MSHHRSWGPEFESLFNQHGPQGRVGASGAARGAAGGARIRRSGPPPWLTGLFGLVGQEARRVVRGYAAATCGWRSSPCSPTSR